jgi:PAS domain S-box-containing protein
LEQNLKKILNTIDEFLLIVDIETGSILEVNDVTVKTLGYSYEELLKMTYLDLHPLSAQEKAKEIFQKVANGELMTFVLPLQTKNGQELVREFKTFLQNLSGRRTIIGLSKRQTTNSVDQ